MEENLIEDLESKLIFLIYRLTEERRRQEDLHPYFPTNDTRRLTILVEEVGEVARAIQEENKENLEDELIQVAAVCLRWLQKIKRE